MAARSTRYIAIRACQANGQFFKEGAFLDFFGDPTPCPFCKSGKDAKTGKPCFKCKGTGRSEPPHHFELVDASHAEQERRAAEAEQAEVEHYRQALKEINVDFDNRWSARELKNRFVKARREKGLE